MATRSEPLKQAESKIVNNKNALILRVLSPIPTVPGKSTVELDGEHAPLRLTDVRPEFYFRLSDYEGVDIVKLTPKKTVRVVENVSILQLKNDRIVDEKFDKVETFKKQEGDLLLPDLAAEAAGARRICAGPVHRRQNESADLGFHGRREVIAAPNPAKFELRF